MARTYKNHSDFEDDEQQFAFYTKNDTNYLILGDISNNDNRFLESLIAYGYVGFFSDDTEEDRAKIVGVYDEIHGVPIEDLPTKLTVGDDYDILFTQARPGIDRSAGDAEYPYSSELGDEAVELIVPDVLLLQAIQVELNESDIDEIFEQGFKYTGGSGTTFQVKWWESLEDWQDGSDAIAEADAPRTVEWIPATPETTQGRKRGILKFQAPAGHIGDFAFHGDITVI